MSKTTDPKLILIEVDSAVAERLERIESELSDPSAIPPPMESIRALLDPPSLGERAEDYFGPSPGWEIARNLLAFLPLILTWAALAGAIFFFGQYAEDRDIDDPTSFLELWQSGFNGTAPAWVRPFHEIALIDVGLLMALIFVSIIHQMKVHQAAKQGRTLRQYLEIQSHDLLRQAEEHLHRRANEAMRVSVTAALQDATGTIGLLIGELKTLVEARERELADLRTFSAGLRESSLMTQNHAERMKNVAEQIQLSIEELKRNTGETAQIREAIVGELNGLSGQVNRLSDGLSNLVRGYADLVVSVNLLAEQLRQDATSILTRDAELAERHEERIRQVDDLARQLAAQHESVHQQIADLVARTPSGNEIAAVVSSAWDATSKANIQELSERLNANVSAIAQLLEQLVVEPIQELPLLARGDEVLSRLAELHHDAEFLKAVMQGMIGAFDGNWGSQVPAKVER